MTLTLQLSPQTVMRDLPASADYCEVSTATRLIADRWSLLVVRELAVGNTRFSEIHDALPGLSRSLLASRLRYLERLGIIERLDPCQGDRRSKHFYALTEVGWGLMPVLKALGDWGMQFRADSDDLSDMAVRLHRMRESIDRSSLPNGRISIQFLFSNSKQHSAWLRVDRAGTRACLGIWEGEPNLIVRSTPATLSDLYWGRRTCRDAIANRDITFEGPEKYARGFSGWFSNRPAVRGYDTRVL